MAHITTAERSPDQKLADLKNLGLHFQKKIDVEKGRKVKKADNKIGYWKRNLAAIQWAIGIVEFELEHYS